MPFEHLEMFAVFETDDVLGKYRQFDIHRRFGLRGLGHRSVFCGFLRSILKTSDRRIDVAHERRDIFRRQRRVGVCQMRCDDLRHRCKQIRPLIFGLVHGASFLRLHMFSSGVKRWNHASLTMVTQAASPRFPAGIYACADNFTPGYA